MIYSPGILVGAASGSVGGTTASRNKGGSYLRTRAIPTNPSTVAQQTVRNIVGTLSAAWGLLTAANRQAWKGYAEQNPVINALGNSILLSGQNQYIKLNSRILRDGNPAVATPPIIPAPGGFLTAVQGGDIGAGAVDLTFTPALDSGNKIALFAAVTNSPGITNVKNRLRFIAFSAVDEPSPWVNDTEIEAVLGTLIVGQTLHIEAAQFDPADGHQSTFLRSSVVIESTV